MGTRNPQTATLVNSPPEVVFPFTRRGLELRARGGSIRGGSNRGGSSRGGMGGVKRYYGEAGRSPESVRLMRRHRDRER